MKSTLLATCFLCAIVASASADIVVPKPNQLVVSNLSAFPKYKFTVLFGLEESRRPLVDKKVYEFRNSAELFVQEGDDKPRPWIKIEMPTLGTQSIKIHVKDVHPGDKGIQVSFDKESEIVPSKPSRKKSASRVSEAWPHFLLAGLGCCGLGLLAPRARRRAL